MGVIIFLYNVAVMVHFDTNSLGMKVASCWPSYMDHPICKATGFELHVEKSQTFLTKGRQTKLTYLSMRLWLWLVIPEGRKSFHARLQWSRDGLMPSRVSTKVEVSQWRDTNFHIHLELGNSSKTTQAASNSSWRQHLKRTTNPTLLTG